MMPRPDALFLPESVKVGAIMSDRVDSACRYAESLLEADCAAGERAHIRTQPHGRLFVTRDYRDTIFFPAGHPRSGQARYNWVRQSDGSEFGYLVEGANDAIE